MEKIGESAFWEGAFDEYSAAHAAAGLIMGNILKNVDWRMDHKIIFIIAIVVAFELFETYYFKDIDHPIELNINSLLDVIIGVGAGLSALYA